MSVTATVFGKYKLAVLAGTAPALDSATLMVGLLTDDWEPDVDADEFWATSTSTRSRPGASTSPTVRCSVRRRSPTMPPATSPTSMRST